MAVRKKKQCAYLRRMAVDPSIKIGGIVSSQCESECFPGCLVCWEHLSKDVLYVIIQDLLRDYKQATGKDHKHYGKGQ